MRPIDSSDLSSAKPTRAGSRPGPGFEAAGTRSVACKHLVQGHQGGGLRAGWAMFNPARQVRGFGGGVERPALPLVEP